MNVLAIVPARTGSKGIPHKNFRELAGLRPLDRAVRCASAAGVEDIVISSDAPCDGIYRWLQCAPPLHTDECPMIDVVKDALARVPGPPDQIIVLLQPTQPLRQPKHIQAAIALLQETQADSVVSVVELPATHHPLMQFSVSYLTPGGFPGLARWYQSDYESLPGTRQELHPTYTRDGTAYAFYRSTVQRFGTIYGERVRALIIPSEETCSLDTPQDWIDAERRLQARS